MNNTRYAYALAAGLALAMISMATAPNLAVARDAATTATAPQTASGDSEALSLLSVVNTHEIEAAGLAESKDVDDDTRDYAKMLIADHSANLKKVTELSQLTRTPIGETPAATALKEQTSAERARLATLDGKAFRTAYLDAMIEGHASVLSTIDTRLLPGASDLAISQHLRQTRESVGRHLEQAKKLRAAN